MITCCYLRKQKQSLRKSKAKEQLLTSVNKRSPGLWQISLPFQGEQEVVGTYVLEGNNELALIDPGPESSTEALLASLREGGWDPQKVTHILITHIHLDHSGGVGTLLHSMPDAQVFVHSKGAPHLSDPGKLITSATRIYKDQMETLWGKIEPVPADHIHAIEGGDILNVAGRRLEVHYTPGHANHHVIFYDVHAGELFAGDAAGVQLPGIDYVRPPTPPPDLDIEAWSNTIDLLKKLRPDVLYLAHYGPARNPGFLLENLRAHLFSWGDIVLKALRDGKKEAEIIQILINETEPELKRKSSDPDVIRRYDITTNYTMTVQGYIRYWKKNQPGRF
jgi:glyoxylase-like metal-dependent hydrolase (beta-lactamase superfamily II)